jgi:H+-transporting ATPase
MAAPEEIHLDVRPTLPVQIAKVSGLAQPEAVRLYRELGPNAIASEEPGFWSVVIPKFIAPVPCLLEAAIVLQLYLGEYLEAAVILVLLIFNAALGLVQESRAKATLAALKSRLALKASVLRDNHWQVIDAAEVVPGDIVKLTLGGVVPADVRVLDGDVLLDQSTLTGESLPIEAQTGTSAFAGALVRRGEAVAKVIATGNRTRFGRAAELIRTAKAASSQQRAVLRVVAYLSLINGLIAIMLIGMAVSRQLPVDELVALGLVSLLASIPVALPATFTLAAAFSAQSLGRQGVLPTRLSAVEEAASINVLCVDKTGTLTSNELAIARIVAMPGTTELDILTWARAASSDGGLDPIDAAVRAEAMRRGLSELSARLAFVPFDPGSKTAEATMLAKGEEKRIIKGAFARVLAVSGPCEAATTAAAELEHEGFRVLGVGVGDSRAMNIVGLLAFSDPPRPEAADSISALKKLGIKLVMLTGDAPETAVAVGHAVGICGTSWSAEQIPVVVDPDRYSIFAGILPEDKFRIVTSLQRAGYLVGMCGDGANDAPALRQAQFGIAVSTSTDVAKSAAGIVLTEPGLRGILIAVTEGRVAFQRILTYTLRSIIHKTRQVSFLVAGLMLTGHSILTPTLAVISLIAGDFFAMSSTTDNVRPSARPDSWRIGTFVTAGAILGVVTLAFCVGVLWAGQHYFALGIDELRTLTMVSLVFSNQAVFYSVRERRRLWSSRPSAIVLACSAADFLIIPGLAFEGFLMAPLQWQIIAAVLLGAIAFALFFDVCKAAVFKVLAIG